MNEEKNIPVENTEESNPKKENATEHFPEDSHAPQPQTTNIEPQTDMEVHKHPHHITHKKKWGEYIVEFLMLFLAVFLGFIAENIREHYVEHNRAKQYAVSLISDLSQDTIDLIRKEKFRQRSL